MHTYVPQTTQLHIRGLSPEDLEFETSQKLQKPKREPWAEKVLAQTVGANMEISFEKAIFISRDNPREKVKPVFLLY